MKIISHRGNIAGRMPNFENQPLYIDAAINIGYEVEIDLRLIEDKLFLGHDNGEHEIEKQWLLARNRHLWIHAKNLKVVEFLDNTNLNWFWHDIDKLTMTSKGYIWCYPEIYLNNGITVELNFNENIPKNILGVCTDYPIKYNEIK